MYTLQNTYSIRHLRLVYGPVPKESGVWSSYSQNEHREVVSRIDEIYDRVNLETVAQDRNGWKCMLIRTIIEFRASKDKEEVKSLEEE